MTAAYKLSGGGNDFLALVEPESAPTAAEVAAWCRRGLSLGADGLFTLRRDAGRARMEYWNADGHPADLCLNGTRCAARLAFDLGWAAGTDALRLATGAGEVTARRLPGSESEIALEVPTPGSAPRPVAPVVDGVAHDGWFLPIGVPHLVLLTPTPLDQAPVATLGPALRRHPIFAPAGTNVSFVRFPAPHRMEIRTFERGVEAETLACGSGTLAAVATGLHLGLVDLPVAALTAGGFTLAVDGASRDGLPTRWSLAGDARLVARLELTPEAAAVPPPPAWSA